MLNNYIDFLKNAMNVITSLNADENIVWDYFTAVGYEFACILLGALLLATMVFIIGFPYVANAGLSYLITKILCHNHKDYVKARKQNIYITDIKNNLEDLEEYGPNNEKSAHTLHDLYTQFETLNQHKISLFANQSQLLSALSRYECMGKNDSKKTEAISQVLHTIRTFGFTTACEKEIKTITNNIVIKNEKIMRIIKPILWFVWILLIIPFISMFF